MGELDAAARDASAVSHDSCSADDAPILAVGDGTDAERLALLADATRDAVFDWDIPTDRAWVNERMRELAGDGPRDCDQWRARIHPDDRAHVEEELRTLLATPTRVRHTKHFRYRTDRGSYLPIEARLRIVRDPTGRPIRVVGAFRDLTPERESLAFLAARERFLSALLANATEAVLVLDAGGRARFCSHQVHELVDPSRDATRWIDDAVHPDDAPAVREVLARVTRTPGYAERWHMRVRDRRGSERHLDAIAQNFLDDHAVHGVVVNWRDVTERVVAEQERRRREALLARTEEVAHVGGWELDVPTSRLTWTPETFRIHELDPIHHQPTLEGALAHFASEHRLAVRTAIERATSDGEPFDLELGLVTATGRRATVRVTARPERERSRVVRLVGALMDVTESARARAQLQQQAEALEQSDDAIAVLGPDLRVRVWNRAAERMSGYGRAAVLGRRFVDIQPDQPANAQLELLLRSALSGTAIGPVEHQARRADARPSSSSSASRRCSTPTASPAAS